MSFLAPLFLLGGLAVAGPLLFHLVRRTQRERIPFGSLMFLRADPPRLDRRSRIEHLLLLLLRMLALGLLAAGFARPFWRDLAPPADPPAAPRLTVFLVDASASMRRPGLWEAASRAVDRELGDGDPGRVAVMTFDQRPSTLLDFDEWSQTEPGARKALVSGRLASATPGWGGSDLGRALVAAAERMTEGGEDAAGAERRILVVSDLQEGVRLDSLQAQDWPAGMRVRLVPVKPPAGNAGLQVLGSVAATDGTGRPAVRLRVVNAPDSVGERFSVGWMAPAGDGQVGGSVDVYVPPGQSRVVALEVPDDPRAAELTRVRLTGDDAPFDNIVHVVPPATARSTVLYLGSESGSDARQPRFFLRRALPSEGPQAVDLMTPDPVGVPDPAVVARAPVTVVAAALTDPWIDVLRTRLEGGGMVVVVLRDAGMGATLGALLGGSPIPLMETTPTGHALLGELDFRHPLLAPFADPRYSDFTAIHFWHYRRLDAGAIPGARIVAGFDGGDPAWIDVPVGKGRLVVMTAGWHPADSRLALSTRFVPLMLSLLELGGGWQPPLPGQFEVGEEVPVTRFIGDSTTAWRIRGPDGPVVEGPAGATAFDRTAVPGVYRLETDRATNRFAVNVPAAESRTRAGIDDQLEALGVPLGEGDPLPVEAQAARREARAAAATEGRQKLWRWFLGATVVVLLMESAVAAMTARRSMAVTEVAS